MLCLYGRLQVRGRERVFSTDQRARSAPDGAALIAFAFTQGLGYKIAR